VPHQEIEKWNAVLGVKAVSTATPRSTVAFALLDMVGGRWPAGGDATQEDARDLWQSIFMEGKIGW
jgi:hypothetical protein